MEISANHKHKILVVDDDIDLNTTFALLLEFDGHEVRTVSNGEAALALLAGNKFDLVITESYLPGMTGGDLAELIKKEWPDQPIILTVANSEEFNQIEHPMTGIDCLLDKPFSISQLREALIAVLDYYAENQKHGLPSLAMLSVLQSGADKTRRLPRSRGHH